MLVTEVIKLINSKLKEVAFSSATTYSISELIPVTDTTERTVLVPTVIDNFGEGVEMSLGSFDDIQFYYRLNSKTTTYNKFQYGDSNKEITDTYQLSMFISVNRTRLKKSAADVSEIISSWIPDVVKMNDKQVAIITQGLYDFNSQSIINSEFPNTDFAGMPDIFMIRQDFQIKRTYRRRCLETCEKECNNYSTN